MNFSLKNTSLLLRVFFTLLVVASIGFLWYLNQSSMVKIKSIGGTLHEGVVGAPRFINPVLAQSQADLDLTRLVFSPLLTVDRDGSVNYILAENVDVSDDSLRYTLSLQRGISFEDGEILDADDVIFTIESIQDLLIKSPLATKWQGVSVEKIDQYTVAFNLARPFADFVYNLEIGILPSHIWANVAPETFIFDTHNTDPVGSGPYSISDIAINNDGVPKRYSLKRRESSLQAGYIEHIIVDFFENENILAQALIKKDVDSAYGIDPSNIDRISESKDIYSATLPRVFALFFNQSNQTIFKSENVRNAINMSINKEQLVDQVFSGYASPIDSPLGKQQSVSVFNIQKAQQLLQQDGWRRDSDGWYVKTNGTTTIPLEFSISIPNIEDMKRVAEYIQQDLAQNGIKVTLRGYDQGNFNQDVLRPREYESMLFGYEIEKPTDLYALWHSSQISDPGLNISIFKDTRVDALLNELRSSKNPDLETLDSAIVEKIPAVFLYAPSYIYVLPENVHSSSFSIVQSSDRFNTLSDWYIQTRHMWKLFGSSDSSQL